MSSQAGRQAWKTIQELWFYGEAHDRMHRICGSCGMTPGLVKALIYLKADAGIAMGDLAGHWGCDASYVTALVDGLEERGLAERRPWPGDRRVKAAALTELGEKTKDQVLAMMWEPPSAFNALSGAEQRQLRDLLAKVAAADPQLGASAEPR